MHISEMEKDSSVNWLLFDCAKKGDKSGVLMALRKGASAHAVDTLGGFTALHHAAQYGHHEVCAVLVNDGAANVNVQTPNGATPLLTASKHGRERVVKSLLSLGGKPNLSSLDGESPLHAACFSGKEAVVRALLAHGADTSLRTKWEGHSPLDVAAARNFVAVVEALLQAGADADARSKDEQSAYDVAAAKDVTGSHAQVKEVLTKHMKMFHAEGDWVYDPTPPRIV